MWFPPTFIAEHWDIYPGPIDGRGAVPPILTPSLFVSLLPRRLRRSDRAMMQDALQLGEMSPSSRSDSGDVVSEAADSQPETTMAQVSPQPDESFWYWTSDLVEEAVRLLAARMPPELFDDILFYVNVHCVSQRRKYGSDDGRNLTRNQGEPSPRDLLTGLKRCSLVCLFWANRCREHMFAGRTLEIASYEDAEIFRRYVVGGCARLTPVHQLIKRIAVVQNYSGELTSQPHKRQTSFLHLLYLPTIQDKLEELSINGPVPDGFSHAKLDTPHWGIPPCNVVPSSFLRNSIEIINVHFPSFSHVIKYIRHFSCTTDISFEEVTWDGQTPTYSLPQASSTIACHRRPRSLDISAKRDCTDSVHLALTALMLNPNCPLHRLSDEKHVWMIKFMTLLWGDGKSRWVSIDFNVSEQRTTMCAGPFHFVFEEAPATDRPGSVLSMVGMHAYIHSLSVNFDALANHARTHPTIRALVLLFPSLDDLQESVKAFVQVLTLAAETIELVLAYEEWKERRAVSVDLATLEPNGCVDTWTDEQSEDYWSIDMSLQMLQRQLKKKRWTSIH